MTDAHTSEQDRLDALWPLAVFLLAGLAPLYWSVTRDARIEWVLVAWSEALANPLIAATALGVGAAGRRWWMTLALVAAAGIGVEACIRVLGWPRFTPLDGGEHLMIAGRILALLFYAAAAALLMGEIRLQNALYPGVRKPLSAAGGRGPKWWQWMILSILLVTPIIQYASFFAYRTRLSFLLALLPALLMALISAVLSKSPPGLPASKLRRSATIFAGWSLLALLALWVPQVGDFGNVTVVRGILTDIAALTGIVLVVALIRRFRKETVPPTL